MTNPSTHSLPYTGAALPGSGASITLFDSTTVAALAGGQLRSRGLRYYYYAFKNSHPFTLRMHASSDGGSNWHQSQERYIAPATVRRMNENTFRVDQHRDVKIDMVNGGSAQTTFYIAQSLLSDDIDEDAIGEGADAFDYIVNHDMEQSLNGPAIQVGPKGRVTMFIQTTATDSPVGLLSLEGTLNGSKWVPLQNAYSELPAFVAGALPAQDIACMWSDLEVEQVRLAWANTSAGSGTGALLNAQLRSR